MNKYDLTVKHKSRRQFHCPDFLVVKANTQSDVFIKVKDLLTICRGSEKAVSAS